jgi:RNA polymerase sigma-70 factor (ECF subfamily)
LFRILRNTFINRYRATKARPEEVDFDKIDGVYEQMVEEEFLRGHGSPDPEEAVMVGVPDEEIQHAMVALPEEYRTVVLMALVEEMSYKEIAAALSIPLGTVMSRLHRGRKELQGAVLEYAKRKGIFKQGSDVSTDETA